MQLVRFAARAAMIDPKVAGGDLFHGVEQEVNEVIGRQPCAQLTGQEHRRLAVKINKTCSQEHQSRLAAFGSNNFHLSFSG